MQKEASRFAESKKAAQCQSDPARVEADALPRPTMRLQIVRAVVPTFSPDGLPIGVE